MYFRFERALVVKEVCLRRFLLEDFNSAITSNTTGVERKASVLSEV